MAEVQILMSRQGETMFVPESKFASFLRDGWKEVRRAYVNPPAEEPVAVETATTKHKAGRKKLKPNGKSGGEAPNAFGVANEPEGEPSDDDEASGGEEPEGN